MIVGIDQGTSSTRAWRMDADGVVRARASRSHTQHHPRPGWIEHDATEIWEATRAVLAEVGASAGDVVGIAHQGETVVLFDRAVPHETAQPLCRAIVWHDDRTTGWLDALAAREPELAALVTKKTGLRLDPYFTAPKLRWLLDHVPGARALADAGRLGAATMDTWLMWKMCGRFVTDPSTAARSLLYDLRAGDWDDELCARFGVPRHVLPEIVPSAGAFGECAFGRIVASVVDQPAAMIGQGCLAAGDAKATFGTGCFVYVNAGASPPAPHPGLLATVAWRRDDTTTYAIDGGVFAAGSVMTWLRDEMQLAGSDAEIDALADRVPDSAGVVCVPALAGLAAPYWRRGVRGAWLGLSLGRTRAHLCRAALEGVAARVAQVIDAVRSTHAIASLRVDGGVAGSAPLLQMVADLAGLPLEVAAEPEATVTGACWLAARAAGVWASDDELRARVKIARVIEPRLGADERAARMARFGRAVELVSSWTTIV